VLSAQLAQGYLYGLDQPCSPLRAQSVALREAICEQISLQHRGMTDRKVSAAADEQRDR